MAQPVELLRTALNSIHRASGARMVDFGGWDMPVQYTGILEEHHAVRTAAGLFDVSHMGEIEIRGPEAAALTDYVMTNHAARLKPGQIQYSGLLYAHGGFVDDLLVHKVAENQFFICANASNQDKDYRHIVEANRFDAEVELSSARYAQLAVQGPNSLPILQQLTRSDLAAIKYYWFTDGEVCGVPARIARSGYTGEDGFEIYVPPETAPRLWEELLAAGRPFGIKPCGLGARNTLRMEAAMALYGHEINAEITPLEANLNWIVKFDKGDFLGRDRLVAQQREGITRKLVGFEMRGRGIARDGYEVSVDGAPSGWVTSGGPAPALNKNIGLCYLPTALAQPGRTIGISIRGQIVEAVTVPTPFYKRAK